MYGSDDGILMTVFICNTLSLISLFTILIFYFIGSGKQYLIIKLYIYQVCALILFFIPQWIGPFFYSFPDRKGNFCFLQEKQEETSPNQQNCMPDTFCRIQGICNNASWFATSLISFYSNQLILKILTVKGNVHGVPARYAELFLVLIVIVVNIGSLFAPFKHYGMQWNGEKIYYVCNLSLGIELVWWWIWQLFINGAVIIYGFINFRQLQRAKQIVKSQINSNIDQIRTLNVNIITIILILSWSINIIFKIVDDKGWLEIENSFWNILWIIPQILVQLLGFFYAEIFFYSFQSQLQPNLSKPLRKIFRFLNKYNLIGIMSCCCFRVLYSINQKQYNQQYDSHNMDNSRAVESNEASLIYNNENTTN